MTSGWSAAGAVVTLEVGALELETKDHEVFTITKKIPRDFSWLEVPTSAITFRTLSTIYIETVRRYAKQALSC